MELIDQMLLDGLSCRPDVLGEHTKEDDPGCFYVSELYKASRRTTTQHYCARTRQLFHEIANVTDSALD
jgi:hypothetical protein